MAQDKTTKSQFTLLFAQIVRLAISLAITIFLGRALAPEEFGFFALVSLIFVLSYALIELGSQSVAAREISQHPQREKSILNGLASWQRLTGITLAAAWFLFAAVDQSLSQQQKMIVYLAATSIPLLHFNAYTVVFQLRQQYQLPVLAGLLMQCLFFIAIILASVSEALGLLVALLVVFRETAIVTSMYLIAVGQLGYSPKPKLFDSSLKPILLGSWRFSMTSLLYNLYFHLGFLLVWWLSTPDQVGSYSASYRLLIPLIPLAGVFTTPLLPVMSSLAQQNTSLFRQAASTQFTMFSGIVLLFAIIGLVNAPIFLHLIYGEQYTAGELNTIPAFRWLVAAMSCSMMTKLLATYLLADEHDSFLLRISVLGLAISLPTASLLVLHLDASGAAIAICATEILVLSTCLYYCMHTGILRFNIGSVLKYLVPACLALGFFTSINLEAPAVVLSSICLGLGGTIYLWQNAEQKDCRWQLVKIQQALKPDIEHDR